MQYLCWASEKIGLDRAEKLDWHSCGARFALCGERLAAKLRRLAKRLGLASKLAVEHKALWALAAFNTERDARGVQRIVVQAIARQWARAGAQRPSTPGDLADGLVHSLRWASRRLGALGSLRAGCDEAWEGDWLAGLALVGHTNDRGLK